MELNTRGATLVGEAPDAPQELDLRGATEVQVNEPGFLTSVRRGMAQSKAALNIAEQSGSAQMYDALDKLERDGDTPEAQELAKRDPLFANHYNLWKAKGKDPAVIAQLKAQQTATIEQNTRNMREAAATTELNPPSPEYEEFQKADGFADAFSKLGKAPISTAVQVAAESLGQQAPALPVMAAAGVTGGPGALAGAAGISSFVQERMGAEAQALAEAGVDPNDTQALIRYYNSPEFKQKQAEGTKKAAVVGAFDAATAGMAGTALAKKPLGNLAAQTGVQMVGGAGGEVAGSLAAGQEVNAPSVISEAIGEIPSAGFDVGTMAARKALNATLLNRVADEKLKEAEIGLNTEQERTVDDVVGAAHKQKLTPLQSKIFLKAAEMGVDAKAALTIAGIESSFDPNAKNPDSSAHGLFQLIDSTWNGVGGGDRSNLDLQIVNGLKSIAATQTALEAQLGRKISSEELYMGHLLGPKGAAIAIRADVNDPQGAFLDTVKKWDKVNADTIVAANGLKGLTNEQALRKIEGMYLRKSNALGNNEQLNRKVKASRDADAAPSEDITGLDATDENLGVEDIDAMLASVEDQPVTEADRIAAQAEDSLTKVQDGADSQAVAEAALLNDSAVDVEEVAPTLMEENPRLPRDLSGASPRFGFGKDLFSLEFASDVDRAAYIIANNARRSERDADFLSFVMKHTGMNEDEAREYGKGLRQQIKEMAKEAQSGTERLLKIGDAKRAESWVSLDEAGTRVKYENPNDTYTNAIHKAPRLDGQGTLEDTPIQAGEVVAVGVDSAHTPYEYMGAMQQTLQDVISRFAPTARVALTFFTEAKGRVSSMTPKSNIGVRNKSAKARGLYQINMRNATGLTSEVRDGTKNPTTQRKITYAAFHEAGHVIALEQMVKNFPPALREKFMNLGVDEYFTEEEFAQMAPEQANVLREYNELKWQTLNNPAFTAEQFALAWLSPWKLGHGAGTRQGLFSFVKLYMGQDTVQRLRDPAAKFALEMNAKSNILSPEEYMAEQFSRYAFSTGMAETSPLSRTFFQRALDTLRAFFKRMKVEGLVKPGVAFAEWVDSLSTIGAELPNKALPEREAVDVVPVKVKPKLKAKAALPETKPEDKPIMPPPAHKKNEKMIAVARGQDYTEKQNANFLLLRTNLAFVMKDDPKVFQHWMDLVRNNRLEDFRDEVAGYIDEDWADEKVRYDTDAPEYESWREVEAQLEKAVPKRAGLKKWFGNGLRKLSDAKYFAMTLEQMAFRWPEVAGLQALAYMKTNYKAFKARLELKGIEATTKWGKLGKEQHGRLEAAMREEHLQGKHFAGVQEVNGTIRFVPSEELAAYATLKGLEPETIEIWLDVKNAHIAHMNALQNSIAKKMRARYKGRPATLKVKLHELAEQFRQIRAEPFLPQTRFGEYAIRVTEDTLDGPKVVHVEFFESAAMRDEAMEQLKKVAGKRKVQAAHYKMTTSILRTLPVELLGTYAQELELTAQERKELRDIADATTRNKTTRKYSSQLAGITGANKDLMRNFADFMWHSANNIAKLHYRSEMKRAVLQIEADMFAAAEDGDIQFHDELRKVWNFADRYVDHMMSPTDEWQTVRSFVVLHQLWGNIKTAVANLGSLHAVWALAATQQGTVKGTARNLTVIAKAVADQFNSVTNRVLRSQKEGGQVWGPDTRWALDQAKQDGLLDESFAAQLAQFANSSTLSRLNFQHGDSVYKRFVWMGMQPQHLIESYVRRVSLVTQFENYLRAGQTKEQAYAKARRDTYLTQGDNSLLNRPEFMRGKYGVFLIYYGYIQNQLYLLSGAEERARNYQEAMIEGRTEGMNRTEARGKYFKTHKIAGETTKMWLAYLMLGGLMGLPGAEDLDNVLEYLAKKFFGTRFSLKEYAYKLAATISEEASAFGVDVNPRSVVHGTFADFSLLGITPSIDMSSSLGLGQVVPGAGGFGDPNAPRGIVKSMGPVGGFATNIWEAAFSDDPAKRLNFLPNTVKGITRAVDDWRHGVRAPSGGKITIDRESGTVRDLTTGENIVRLMGFRPEIIAANQEIHWMQKEQQQYWTVRRNQLVAQMAEAKLQDDREAIADAQMALERFNDDAPRELKINPKEMRLALKRKAKAAKQDERRQNRQKRFRRMDEELAREVLGQEED